MRAVVQRAPRSLAMCSYAAEDEPAQNIVTLMLTGLALGVAEDIPKLGYLTFLDRCECRPGSACSPSTHLPGCPPRARPAVFRPGVALLGAFAVRGEGRCCTVTCSAHSSRNRQTSGVGWLDVFPDILFVFACFGGLLALVFFGPERELKDVTDWYTL